MLKGQSLIISFYNFLIACNKLFFKESLKYMKSSIKKTSNQMPDSIVKVHKLYSVHLKRTFLPNFHFKIIAR